MTELLIGYLLNIGLFASIGFGLAIFLLRPPERVLTALLLSPLVGIALTTIVGTWLVVCDLPVSRWNGWWTAFSLAMSAALTARSIWMGEISIEPSERVQRLAVVTLLLVTAALLFAPQAVGGLKYSMVRGNAADTINYIACAGFMEHEPYSSRQLDVQTLLERHQSYLRVKNLLDERWSTHVLFAFSSDVSGVPPYQFDYAFTALFLLFSAGPAYLLLRQMRVPMWISVISTIAVCTGFWAQYVFDIRAVSHLNSIPLLLGVVFLIGRIDERPLSAPWREYIALGVLGGALLLLYPEIVPMTALAIALFFAGQVLRRSADVFRLLRYIVPLGIAALVASPVFFFIVRFLETRLRGASSDKKPDMWVTAGQNWLYSEPILGFWGFSPFTKSAFGSALVSITLHHFFFAMGGVLMLLLLLAAARVWSGRLKPVSTGTKLLSCMIIACMLQSAFLLSRGQRWETGKALSYGFPFVMIAVTAYPFNFGEVAVGWMKRRIIVLGRCCVVIWLLVQCCLGVSRSFLASSRTDFSNYIWHHGEYHLGHDLNFRSITSAMDKLGNSSTWSYIPNVTVSEYASFALGWNVRICNLLPTIDSPLAGQKPEAPGRFLLMERREDAVEAFSSASVISQSGSVSLLTMEQNGRYLPVLAELGTAKVVKRPGGQVFLRLTGGANRLTVISPINGFCEIRGDFEFSGAQKNRVGMTMRVNSGDARLFALDEGASVLRFSVKVGLNIVELDSIATNLASWVCDIGNLKLTAVERPTDDPDEQHGFERVSTMEKLSWNFSQNPGPGIILHKETNDSGTILLNVESTVNTDICFVAPIHLSQGLYRLSGLISGEISGLSSGAAHLSIHGRKKIISFPSGVYKSQPFSEYLNVESDLDGAVAFGLGGWSEGKGRIVLERLFIERLR